MQVFTIGFAQTPASEFFGRLKEFGIRRLMDVRLNNTSQLAGYAKQDDLRYLLREICNADYVHEPMLAPTQSMLDKYKKNKGRWNEYEIEFMALMKERSIEKHLDRNTFATVATVLLCSERLPDHCHRRLVLEYMRHHWTDLVAVHL